MEPGTDTSERVHRLLATCIQVTVRRHFDVEISFSQAAELARVHTLTNALAAISRSIEVQPTIYDTSRRFGQALYEATLGPGAVHETVDGRRKNIETYEDSHKGYAEQEVIRRSLNELQNELREWRRDYVAFLNVCEQLYQQRRDRLMAMRLDGRQEEEAIMELDHLFADAITDSVA